MTRPAAIGGKKQLYGAKKRIGIYAGQYYDQETGLHYNWNRYYDPTLGRYLRSDPSLLKQGSSNIPYLVDSFIESPQNFNSYTYVQNNPIISIDPKGLCSWSGKFYYGGIQPSKSRPYGAIAGRLKIKSKCCNGWRAEASCNIVMVGFTAGVLPIQFGVATISDMLGPDTPGWNDPAGLVSYFSGTAAPAPHPDGGRGSAAFGCGSLYTAGTGSVRGLDLGVDAMFGVSVCWGKKECCNQ